MKFFTKGTLMQIKLSKFTVVMCLAAFINGCANSETNTHANAKNQLVDTQAYVKITKEELAQLKSSSAQWQAMKSDLDRLLLIENDLTLLISQLNSIAESDTKPMQTNATAEIASQPPKKHTMQANSTAPAASQSSTAQPLTEKTAHTAIKPRYALQLLSVTQQSQLATGWQALQNKAPQLFNAQLITNAETAEVKGVTYYRLKLGAYQNKKNAQTMCNTLKASQINCLVTYYTDQPLEMTK
jgi:cell division septation protein DedD